MSNITTMKISKENRDKLKLLAKNDKKSLDAVLSDLLAVNGGEIINDVLTIDREKTALSLKYWETKNNSSNKKYNFHIYDITFKQLKESVVGVKFVAYDNPAEKNFITSVAEIIFKRGDDVVLLVKEIFNDEGELDFINTVVHVKLF